MDTREKIVPPSAATAMLAEGRWLVVTGRFDPVTSFEAERLAELGQDRNILAVVLDEQDALLEASARAVLLAGLRDVKAVVVSGPKDWSTMLPEGAAVEIVDGLAGEPARRQAFIEMVASRQ